MRGLLIAIAASAVMILVGKTIYPNFLRRAYRAAVMQLLITPAVAGTDPVVVDTNTMQQLLVKDAEFQKIKVVGAIKNQQAWLRRRVVINEESTIMRKGGVILSVSVHVGDEVTPTDVDTILKSVARVVQSEGTRSNMRVQVISQSIYK